MAFVPAPNTIQCDVLFMYFGQRVENVLHVQVPGGVDAATIDSTAEEVRDWVQASLLPLLVPAVSFIGVEAKNLSIEAGGTAFAAAIPPVLGGSVGDGMPGGTAFVVTLKTAQTGRSFRGRKFVFGLNRSQIVGNQIGASYAADIVDAFNDLIAVLAAVSKLLVIVSRIQDKIKLTTAEVTPVTIASFADLDVDSQRRRLTGRGT